MKRLLIGTFLIALVLSGCSEKARPPGQVGMSSDHAFDPKEITIESGETVTWINDSSEAHTVTALEESIPEGVDYFASGGFSSEDAARDDVGDGLLKEGETFEVTFDVPGTFRYVCLPHEDHGMAGTIVVR